MDEIEILKKDLNTEKVFYDLNWHELVLDSSFDPSAYENFDPFKNGENGKLPYTLQDKEKNGHVDSYLAGEYIHKSEKNNTSRDDVRGTLLQRGTMNKNKKADKGGRPDKSANSGDSPRRPRRRREKRGTSNGQKQPLIETEPIPSTPIHFCIPNIPRQKKTQGEIKKCEFIEEIKSLHPSSPVSFIPPVDILYDEEKVVFYFFISGDLQNFNISSNNNYVTISGRKIPYDDHRFANYYSHEIKGGYFVRSYLFMKPIQQENIRYEHRDGVVKVFVFLSKGEK
ncbi:conserved Plasmodium protein, unknown function [Plasmodium knowlesi strain H]|uniref:SHSP domain-containing protein n=3 Tax=Plasmodium knowlesi TaxID=5850 RepID=A0A5K1V0F0_PLAKH|nr:conserved Plasmodium protein, unknown function [Plasmodium knowlesi strain H]OTN64281.1 Uncharacterized protein PKNOH_S140274700 [Plasmodium knowlesi]CAA9991158.1 conserved Plasmodium protein, unknown function [Plasmodium knowlesi strain H]SBO27130.1 conserved Plasmodium protein, unknown function [Plasmodium knowlesi strain H]SBO29366.1 conserved Plasmodium protein, unknown function [Plasmodium knowlesi strain H]VVS80632.1 conserved Plasmodium protein, unknown function [Plasmodium knowlesi |eukprot:XP_002262451.1 hypothetical protein, conserved in Plasmodium species [Plasmodium knowlesi strain H]